ncbi:acetyl-CoA carboxylase biotin carboxylase subunit family protein [Actinoplanes sp. DH11]|uniref:ATP-grasp domain-containing protein n=1 Tax=Actinoplanes sp. DH11 TaxID=2857011 RepID=UPI001E51B6CB|nr:ATP-grasp domain-containing protein [Actinoplanes sp. DH11]
MSEEKVFVQVGGTRDGMDPYLDAARRRDMRAVLVETPDYLRWRGILGRRDFDAEVALDAPADPAQLHSALTARGIHPNLILAGFERYVDSCYRVAAAFGCAPAGQSPAFAAPYKRDQRAAMTTSAARVRQPRHATMDSLDGLEAAAADMTFPVVVKPDNAGGGLGIVLVSDVGDLAEARRTLGGLANYDGGAFTGWMVEEFVPGVEVSVQAIARDGTADILSTCEKLTYTEPVGGLATFREAGHIAFPGSAVDTVTRQFVQDCIDAVGYRQGPFHVDMIRGNGQLHLLEMGFRLSGMRVVELVTRVSGRDWGDESIAAHLGETPAAAPAWDGRYAGHVTLRHAGELVAAESVGAENPSNAEVQRFTGPQLPADWSGGVPESLRSDVGRHAGALGRLVVTGDDPRRVTNLLQCCLVSRNSLEPIAG